MAERIKQDHSDASDSVAGILRLTSEDFVRWQGQGWHRLNPNLDDHMFNGEIYLRSKGEGYDLGVAIIYDLDLSSTNDDIYFPTDGVLIGTAEGVWNQIRTIGIGYVEKLTFLVDVVHLDAIPHVKENVLHAFGKAMSLDRRNIKICSVCLKAIQLQDMHDEEDDFCFSCSEKYLGYLH